MNRIVDIVLRMTCLMVLLSSCQVSSKVSLKNLVTLYESEQQFSDLDCAVFHMSDTTTALFVEVRFNDLDYRKDPFTGLYISAYRLSYKLTTGYESPEILDSGVLESGDSLNYGKSASIIHSFELKARRPGEYLLEISLMDLNRQAAVTRFARVHKGSMMGRQNFLVVNRDNGLMFKNYLREGEEFKVLTGDPAADRLYVSFYRREFQYARPPFAEDAEPVFEYRPDSAFLVPLYSGETGLMTLPHPGFYHFRKDTNSREGLTLFRYHEGFPEVITAESLRDPLRYITTRKEYDSLLSAVQLKAAVDAFWLKSARSPERARILIRKYYSNVEEANRLFTSYLEGWKSDRGLIYIVFGRPDYVYRTDDSEDWIYGEPGNRSSLRFTFVRVNNHFTDNDFMLFRSPTYKDSWFITVQSWRR